MKIFISWSGVLSQAIAKELRNWLPHVIHNLEVFLSEKDIDKGSMWMERINQELEQSFFGIICLTKENLNSPWILFEAGALAKNINHASVSCVLFDNLKQTDISGPLSLFQNSLFTRDDIWHLLVSINKKLVNGIKENILEKSFEKWWPDLNKSIEKCTAENYRPSNGLLMPTTQSLILRNTYDILSMLRNKKGDIDSFDFLPFAEEVYIKYFGNDNNHPVQVTINPVEIEGHLKQIIVENESVVISDSSGPNGRGVEMQIIFSSEHGEFWYISIHFHKGQTFLTSNYADFLSQEEKEKFFVNTIWRD